MTAASSGPGDTDTRDEEILADLFDTLLQEILEGNTPDLSQYQRERPDLHDRIQKTWALACSVAGRREPSRPVLGGYEILRELGHGGMGTVYLARHQVLQRDVAIKVLPHSLAMSPRAKQRFLEEARALARLQHDHVVHIHRVIDHAEMLAFEMEFVDGPSLQQVVMGLRTQPRPHSLEALAQVLGCTVTQLGARTSVEWFVRVGIRIARALAEVHRHGLVHRDVKPSNILLRADGTPVLADFGLARMEDLEAPQASGFAGTPVYAAPERLRGGDGDIDARADVYSLGVSLYETLSLSPPFAGSTTHEVLRRIENGRLPALRKQAPHVSRDLEIVLGKAMEADRRHRYASADAFAEDLERLLNLQPILARPAGPLRRTWQFLRRHQRVVAASLIGAVLAAAATWPALAHANARESARREGQQALQAARSQVLALENLQVVSLRAFAGSSSQRLRQPTALHNQQTALQRALQHYERAQAALPEHAEIAVERSVLRLALRIREADGTGLAEHTTGLPVLLARVAANLATGHNDDGLREAAAKAPTNERFAAGLLAFLCGDLVQSHWCWRGLDTEELRHPLLEACLALQLASDGYPERAYPRLFHAARELPGVAALELAMADAALAMGDTDLARSWLQRLPSASENPIIQARRLLLATDLQLADGDIDGAARGYRQLFQLDPTDPLPALRLAALAAERGDRSTAQRVLGTILARWPDHAGARLEQARLCLIHRDLPGYLAQARYVLGQELAQRPRASASMLAEILRLGGLHNLRQAALPDEPLRTGSFLRQAALPLAAWLAPARLQALELTLPLLATMDRCHQQARDAEPVAIAAHLRTLRLASKELPGLVQRMPWLCQAAMMLPLPWLDQQITDWLTVRSMPHLSTLGTRVRIIEEEPLVRLQLPQDLPLYGQQLALAEDCDGDTLRDLVVACPPVPKARTAGYVEIRSLHDGELLRTLRGDNPDLIFARSITVLDDVDGDLCSDILVGAPRGRPQSGNTGEILLYSGRTGEVLWRLERPHSAFGVSLATMRDLDGDGKSDILVGASSLALGNSDRGRAFLVSGATGRVLRELQPDRGNTWFGAAVANAGDVDGDGVDDALVGGNYGQAAGLVMVFSGRTGAAMLTLGDESPQSDFGQACCSLGDITGDGIPDLAISAPAVASRGKQIGKVQVFSGSTGLVLHEIFGEIPGEGFGNALAAVQGWVAPDRISLAIAARRGGPVGTGYVRVFDAATGSPQQTHASGPRAASFAHSLLPIGHRQGARYPSMLIPLISRDASAAIMHMSFGQTQATSRSR